MGWHMTPLMDHGMVVDVLKPLKFIRDLGLPVRSAMNTDVNGLPWGVVDALLYDGITGISMAINEHYGHALRPWPRAFNWQAPGGRSITAYNGFIYGVTSDKSLHPWSDMDEARVRVPAWTKRFEDMGYPHPFLMMQITNIRYHDNGAPQAGLPDFVQRFNEGNASTGGVKLRIGTITEFFDRVRAQPADTLPTLRGDWTDWWNFRRGQHGPRDGADHARGQRDLDAALAAEAWHAGETPRRRAMLHDIARNDLAPRRAHLGGGPLDQPPLLAGDTHAAIAEARHRCQWRERGAHASPGRARATGDRCRRRRAAAAGVQPAPVRGDAVGTAARLPPMGNAPDPKRGFGLEDLVPTGPSSHRIQRQDVVMSDLTEERAYWTAPIKVPALSYVTMPADSVVPAATTGLEAQNGALSNSRVTLTLDEKSGGVTSLKLDGVVEYAGKAAEHLTFGVPVLEVASGSCTAHVLD